jgi:signal transduction histidine kinase
MRVVDRLYLAAVPGVLAVLAVGALTYWGRYARQVPPIVVIIAAGAAAASLAFASVNARFIARRIERLAAAAIEDTTGTGGTGAPGATLPQQHAPQPDEIDRIEGVINRLGSAVQVAAADNAERERELEQRNRDYAQLLRTVADQAAKQIEEIRLPLHILLENRFGEVNENQEEMLGAARGAADAADAAILGLRQIAELDLGTRPLRRDRIRPSELVEGIRAQITACAPDAQLEVEIEPLVPAIVGDRARLQEALVTLFGDSARAAKPGGPLRLTLGASEGRAVLQLDGAGPAQPSIQSAVATRIVAAHGGEVTRADGRITISIPFQKSTGPG